MHHVDAPVLGTLDASVTNGSPRPCSTRVVHLCGTRARRAALSAITDSLQVLLLRRHRTPPHAAPR